MQCAPMRRHVAAALAGLFASAPQATPVHVKTAQPQKVADTSEYVATLKSRDTAVESLS